MKYDASIVGEAVITPSGKEKSLAWARTVPLRFGLKGMHLAENICLTRF